MEKSEFVNGSVPAGYFAGGYFEGADIFIGLSRGNAEPGNGQRNG